MTLPILPNAWQDWFYKSGPRKPEFDLNFQQSICRTQQVRPHTHITRTYRILAIPIDRIRPHLRHIYHDILAGTRHLKDAI